MPNSHSHEEKKSLRKAIQVQRQRLSDQERRIKSQALIKTVGLGSPFLQSHRIAFYWPAHGEIDPGPLMKRAFKFKKHCYLPVLHPLKPRELVFVEYKPGDPLFLNRYGIYEPQLRKEKQIVPWMLNLVLVPLLSFDTQGHRLGRGQGYYDRTFDFIKTHSKPLHPKLIGLAYDFQQREQLPAGEWDIVLSGIATESRLLHFPCLESRDLE